MIVSTIAFLAIIFSYVVADAALVAPITLSPHPTTEDPSDVKFLATLITRSRPLQYTIDTGAPISLNSCSKTSTLSNTTFTFATTNNTFVVLSRIKVSCGRLRLAALGPADTALPVQLTRAAHLPPTFAYCLPHQRQGYLFFGSTEYTLKSAPLVTLVHFPLYLSRGVYKVHLTGVKFGNQPKIGVPGPNVLFGTSSRYTRLPVATYDSLRSSFINVTSRAPGIVRSSARLGELDLCYRGTNSSSFDSFPNVSLVFSRRSVWQVTPRSYLVPTRTPGVFCFGFVSAGSQSGSIGTFQQQEYVVEFNLDRKSVGISTRTVECDQLVK